MSGSSRKTSTNCQRRKYDENRSTQTLANVGYKLVAGRQQLVGHKHTSTPPSPPDIDFFWDILYCRGILTLK